MGKGTIRSESGGGQYNITIVYAGRSRVNAKIADLQAVATALENEIATMDEGLEKEIAKLRLAAFNKQIEYLQDNMPADLNVNDVWCVDYTTELTGDVGMIEVPGERSDGVNIMPGQIDSAVYNEERDGQLLPSIATSPEAAYFNRAIMPGWQKWKPTFRYGKIVVGSINFQDDTCDICLNPAYSSQQNLDINQGQGFSDCPSVLLSGYEQFCTDNPTHPACTNTNDAGNGLLVSDAMLAQIRSINASVNAAHEYESDASGYRIGEFWAIMGPGDTGDCEDFALTKMQELLDAGYDIRYLQLAWGYTETGNAHAVLVIRTSNRGALVLDNRTDEVKEIGRVPYEFESYQRAGQSWANFSIRLEAVPIEYMTCNAEAFADGDEVVIKFEDQDYEQPKVIGFKANPQRCDFAIYSFFGSNQGRIYVDAFYLNLTTQAFSNIQPSGIAYTNREEVSSFRIGSLAYIIGGWAREFTTPPTQPYGILNLNTQFNLNTNTWLELTTIPVSVRSGIAAFAIGSKGYIIGGGKYFDTADEDDGFVDGNVYNDNVDYDPLLTTYSFNTNCPVSRMGHRGFVLNGKAHIIGGHDRYYLQGGAITRDIQSNHYAYDPDLDSWDTKNNAIGERTQSNSTEINGIGFSWGAWKMSGLENTQVVDNRKYDPDADSWTAISHPFPTTAFTNSFAREANDKGYIASSARFYYEYTPETDSYEAKEGEFNPVVAYQFTGASSGEVG